MMPDMKVYIEKLCHTAPPEMKLGRNVRHDSRSLNFAFDTRGLEIKSVKHERFIPILDQGEIGACTGNAGVGAIHTSPFINKENNIFPGTEQGALNLYAQATAIDPYTGTYPPNDTGSDGLSIAKILKEKGLISGYQHCFTLEDALKALTVYPIMVGTKWYSDMFYPNADGSLRITGGLSGGHEYVIGENIVEEGCVWLDNSWTENWGISGRAKLSWADLATLLSQQGDVIVLIPPTETPPTPIVYTRTLRLTSPMMRGDDVKELQTNLTTLGYPTTADGWYGRNTELVVKRFQFDEKIQADGIVGKITQRHVQEALEAKKKL